MAKINYFQDMEQRYQSNGNESWLNLIKPADIQKSAVKRIFRENQKAQRGNEFKRRRKKERKGTSEEPKKKSKFKYFDN